MRYMFQDQVSENSRKKKGVMNGKDVVEFEDLYDFLRGHRGAYVGSALEHSVTKDRRLRE
jgi:hypothetical protein